MQNFLLPNAHWNKCDSRIEVKKILREMTKMLGVAGRQT